MKEIVMTDDEDDLSKARRAKQAAAEEVGDVTQLLAQLATVLQPYADAEEDSNTEFEDTAEAVVRVLRPFSRALFDAIDVPTDENEDDVLRALSESLIVGELHFQQTRQRLRDERALAKGITEVVMCALRANPALDADVQGVFTKLDQLREKL